MLYFLTFKNCTFSLPPTCLALPIGQHIPPHVSATRLPTHIDTVQRKAFAKALGEIANVMARHWIAQMLSSGRRKIEVSYTSQEDVAKLHVFYELFEERVKEIQKRDVEDLNKAVEALSAIV